MAGFAIVDVTTTGLVPGGTDRVVEVAVVQLSGDGTLEGKWHSVLHPGRGRAGWHRIRPTDVPGAPRFDRIAPQLLDLLSGRVIVAHNASRTLGVLCAELGWAGHSVPADIVSVCTMQLAREFVPGVGRSLADCCAALGIELGIELDRGYRAAAGAGATARLLAAYIEAADAPEFWAVHLSAAAALAWTDGGVRAGVRLRAGDRVVLTGTMSRVRRDWERALRDGGLEPCGAVTRRVRLLVAADTGSLSGKARTARAYGIPIVDEATLAGLLKELSGARLSGARLSGAPAAG